MRAVKLFLSYLYGDSECARANIGEFGEKGKEVQIVKRGRRRIGDFGFLWVS